MKTLLPLPADFPADFPAKSSAGSMITAFPSRRQVLRTVVGGALLLGAASAGLFFALRRRLRDELVFVVRAPRGAPLRLHSGELLSVDWTRQVWSWPRRYLEDYWRDPAFFPAGALFSAEFRGAELFRGRIANAVDARAAQSITMRVLQLRSGPGPGALLSGDLGFAFALTDAAGRPAFPCGDARVAQSVRRMVGEIGDRE